MILPTSFPSKFLELKLSLVSHAACVTRHRDFQDHGPPGGVTIFRGCGVICLGFSNHEALGGNSPVFLLSVSREHV